MNTSILHNSYLTKTRQGVSFDGYIKDAHICNGVLGRVYSASPRFTDGDTIETSEVVETGFIPAIGHYIETKNGSRYHVANTGESSCQSGVIDQDMKQKETYIKNNINYFKELQWS